MTDIIPIGPWPQGQDTFHALTHGVYQPQESGVCRLRNAFNVDLDDEGQPTKRLGFVSRSSRTALRQLKTVGNSIFLQDGSVLYSVNTSDWSLTSVVTGLSGDVQLTSHAGQVFWSTGVNFGRIENLTSFSWGLDICPTPVLTTTAGSLPAGDYIVVGEFMDSAGILGGSNVAGKITLTSTGGISVNFSPLDTDAIYVRIYMSDTNGDVMYYIADVAVGSLPYSITQLSLDDTQSWKVGLGPPLRHDFSFSYQDRLMLVDGKYVYPSFGAAAHLYDYTEVFARPETILAAGGLPEGFWTASSNGAYWTGGNTIQQMRQVDLVTPVEFCAGSLKINTHALPGLGLNSNQPAILFWSEWGLAVGLSGGQMLFPHKSQHRESVVGKQANFVYREFNEFEQLLVQVR